MKSLRVYDPNKNFINLIDFDKESNIRIEASKNGDEKLIFYCPLTRASIFLFEGYIRTSEQEYVIKFKTRQSKKFEYTCYLNLEELEGKAWDRFNTTEQTISDALRLALSDTGYTIKYCDVTKKRTIKLTACSSLDIINEAIKIYKCYVKYDTINKTISIYQNLGEDKGTYFHNQLNLKTLNIQCGTTNFYTRIVPEGKNGLTIESVNGGKNYLENYQYSNKVLTYYWKDERYTIAQDLKDDAESKLEELSKPAEAYSADVRDLASIYPDKYNFLSYDVCDWINIVDTETNIKIKQTIVKTIRYLVEPHRNKIEIANTYPKFEDVQKQYQTVVETVNNITSDNGTIAKSAIAETVKILTEDKVNINDLNVVKERVGTLEANTITTTAFNAKMAEINELMAGKATVVDLNAGVARIGALEANTGIINSLLTGSATIEQGQVIHLTGENVVFDNAIIKDAMIESLSLSKLKAGDISTNTFRLVGTNGNLILKDNTLQIKDDNETVRVQIGKDTAGDYNILVRDTSGNVMFSSDGITDKAIKDKIIRNDMVSDTANINAKKLDIDSLIEEVNNNNTKSLKASKVTFDSTGQSAEVSFKNLSSTLNNISIGGRNLIRTSNVGYSPKLVSHSYDSNTNTWTLTAPAKNEDTWGIGLYINYTNVLIPYGKTYILSWEMKVPKECIWNIDVNVYAKTGSSWNGNDNDEFGKRATSNRRITTPNQWVKCWSIISNTNPLNVNKVDIYDNSHFGVVMTNETANMTYYIRNVKGEIGNKPTEWVPAIEDEKEITDALQTSIKTANGNIETLIKDTTVTVGGVDTKLKDAYTSTKATVDSLSTTVSNHSTSISGLTETVKSHSTSITQMNNTIDLKANSSDVTQAINNIKVGGTNLYKGTRDFNSHYWFAKTLETFELDSNYKQATVVAGTDGSSQLSTPTSYQGFDFSDTSKTWTISALFKSSTKNNKIGITVSGGRIGWSKKTISEASTWIKLSWTFTGDGKSLVRFRFEAPESGLVKIAKIKVEEGNKATDYTEAIEDINSRIGAVDSKYSELILGDNGISAKVTAVTNKANSNASNISNLSGTVGGHTTKINSIETAITAKEISATISSGLSGGTASLKTAKYVVDSTGIHVKNAGIDIANNAGKKVLEEDSYGNVIIRGTFEQWSSDGVKSIAISGNQVRMYDWESTDVNGTIVKDNFVSALETVNGDDPYGTRRCKTILTGKYDSRTGKHAVGLGFTPISGKYVNDNTYSDIALLVDPSESYSKGQGKIILLRDLYASVGCNINIAGKTEGVLGGKIFTTDSDDLYMGSNYDINSGTLKLGSYHNGSWYSYLNVNSTGVAIKSDMTCTGTKNRVVKTDNYGWRAFNAYETTECYFGDIMELQTDDKGYAYITFDPIFLETVNTKLPYSVSITVYGEDDDVFPIVKCIKREVSYFVIKSNIPDIRISVEVKCKQRGYEDHRMKENFDMEKLINDDKQDVSFTEKQQEKIQYEIGSISNSALQTESTDDLLTNLYK